MRHRDLSAGGPLGTTQFSEEVLETLKVSIQRAFTSQVLQDMDLRAGYDMMRDILVLELSGSVAAEAPLLLEHTVLEYHARTTWDHFKLRHPNLARRLRFRPASLDPRERRLWVDWQRLLPDVPVRGQRAIVKRWDGQVVW